MVNYSPVLFSGETIRRGLKENKRELVLSVLTWGASSLKVETKDNLIVVGDLIIDNVVARIWLGDCKIARDFSSN